MAITELRHDPHMVIRMRLLIVFWVESSGNLPGYSYFRFDVALVFSSHFLGNKNYSLIRHMNCLPSFLLFRMDTCNFISWEFVSLLTLLIMTSNGYRTLWSSDVGGCSNLWTQLFILYFQWLFLSFIHLPITFLHFCIKLHHQAWPGTSAS